MSDTQASTRAAKMCVDYLPVLHKRPSVKKGDNGFYSWISSTQYGQEERRHMVIESLKLVNHGQTGENT